MAHANGFDLELDYDQAKEFFEQRGGDVFIKALELKATILRRGEFNLYSISVDWLKDRTYCLKAKGTHGDLLIGWTR